MVSTHLVRTALSAPLPVRCSDPTITTSLHVHWFSRGNPVLGSLIGLFRGTMIGLTISEDLSPQDKGIWIRSFALTYNRIRDRETDLRVPWPYTCCFKGVKTPRGLSICLPYTCSCSLWLSALPHAVASYSYDAVTTAYQFRILIVHRPGSRGSIRTPSSAGSGRMVQV